MSCLYVATAHCWWKRRDELCMIFLLSFHCQIFFYYSSILNILTINCCNCDWTKFNLEYTDKTWCSIFPHFDLNQSENTVCDFVAVVMNFKDLFRCFEKQKLPPSWITLIPKFWCPLFNGHDIMNYSSSVILCQSVIILKSQCLTYWFPTC